MSLRFLVVPVVLVVGLLGDSAIPASEMPHMASHSSGGTIRLPLAIISPSVPVQLEIPELNISSPVIPVGLDRNGAIGTPCDPENPYLPCETNTSAWYEGSVRPGEDGNAVLDGHVNWYGPKKGTYVRASFTDLHKAKLGEIVIILDRVGTSRRFKIDQITVTSFSESPATMLSRSGPPGVWLVTCAGPFINKTVGDALRVWVHASAY